MWYDSRGGTKLAMITDDELERTARQIQDLTPNIGQVRLLGAVRSRGLNIQVGE